MFETEHNTNTTHLNDYHLLAVIISAPYNYYYITLLTYNKHIKILFIC